VIFDLHQVEYIDSAGVGLLALASGKTRAAGGKLGVVSGSGRVLEMLKLTQMTAVLSVSATVPEAQTALG
jgi:anti-anti-sigma factor